MHPLPQNSRSSWKIVYANNYVTLLAYHWCPHYFFCRKKQFICFNDMMLFFCKQTPLLVDSLDIISILHFIVRLVTVTQDQWTGWKETDRQEQVLQLPMTSFSYILFCSHNLALPNLFSLVFGYNASTRHVQIFDVDLILRVSDIQQ